MVEKYSKTIVKMYNNGIRPVFIATHLRKKAEDPDLIGINNMQVYNALIHYRLIELRGRTPMQFLYDQLKHSTLNVFFRELRKGRY